MSLGPGTRLGPYEIVALLGAGGMGEVYRARDSRLGRDVAVKVLPASFSTDPDRLARFEQEARAAAALNHPGILAVFDIGSHDRSPYIVSELLEGDTLRERVSGLSVRKAIDYAIQIAQALAAAHDKGIVHRDLKPENIFITDQGRAKILDFGLAKLTHEDSSLTRISVLPTSPGALGAHPNTIAGVVLGTVGYMAPEQCRGLAADHRSDIFAFGAILYEMLAGQRAFRGDTMADAMTAILKDDPQDLPAAERHIPPALERITERCLEKDPAARFQSTRDLAFALEGLSSQSHVRDVAESPVPGKRAPWTWWTATIVACAAAAVLGVALYRSRAPAGAETVRFTLNVPQDSVLTTATRQTVAVRCFHPPAHMSRMCQT
jgi:eukaryotic-like serine/threonine-protein kinase